MTSPGSSGSQLSPEIDIKAPEYLSITEVGKRLGVSDSTLRSWRNKFPAYVVWRQSADGKVYSVERFRELHRFLAFEAKQPPALSYRDIARELARRYPTDAQKAGLKAEPEDAPVAVNGSGRSLAPLAPPSASHAVRGPSPESAALVGLISRLDEHLSATLAALHPLVAERTERTSERAEIAALTATFREIVAAVELAQQVVPLLERSAEAAERSAEQSAAMAAALERFLDEQKRRDRDGGALGWLRRWWGSLFPSAVTAIVTAPALQVRPEVR